MKVVIDIPDNEYYTIKEMNLTLHTEMLKGSVKDWENASTILNLLESVKSGTVLPKGHGDLIDELCRLRSDLKSGLYVGSTLRTQAQMNKFVGALDEIIDNSLIVEPEELKRVRDICEHWNDNSSSFVAACNAFEDILHIFKMGVGDIRGDNDDKSSN